MSKSLVEVTNILTPFLTHLKEMELELKCPICSSLLKDPKLLPCDHIFCSHCIVVDTKIGSCFVCKKVYNAKDMISAIIIQKMVTIFNKMDAAIGAIFLKNGSEVDASGSDKCIKDISEKMLKIDTGHKGVQDISKKMLGIDIGKPDTMRPHDPCAGNKNTSNHKDVKIEDGPDRFIHDAVDAERVNQMVVNSPHHHCNKTIEDGNSDQVNEPRKNILMPIYPRKAQFNSDTEMETDVKSQSAKHFSDMTQDSRCLANTENTKSVSRRQEGCNPEPKRQKRGSTCGRPRRIMRMDAPIECAFCHSFRTTLGSGDMEHYLKGKEMKGEDAFQPKVIHVHEKCLRWTPLAYFEDENTLVGLEKELSRASKIKCDKCGLKGAALGCIDKNCSKSYHVPCAYEIPTCRWVNYDLYCPSHASEALPCDESKSANEINSKDSTSAQRVPTPGFHMERRWVLCGSDLSASEDELVRKLSISTGATVTELWDQNVTHVIASTDKDGACSRTFKVLMAILNGKWVVTTAWVKDYLEAKHHVAEERYEVGLDYYGVVDGPKKGRLRVMEKAPKIFAGLQFSFTGDFKGKGNVEKLILAAGGTVVKKSDWLSKHDANVRGSSLTSYVVYADVPPEVNEEPPEVRDLVDPDKVLRRRIQKAENLAAKTGSRVISHKWISDAIAASSLECS